MKRILFLFFITNISMLIFSFEESGFASWYGPKFHGKKTANGEIFNTNDLTAAHKTLPFNSIVKVISLDNKKEVIVRINDRGPFVEGRIIDLSQLAAEKIDLIAKGTAKVKITLLESGSNKYHRYSNQRYSIQVASFSNKDYATKMKDKLRKFGIDSKINEVESDKIYYRILIENINYSELQLYRVKLHNAEIRNFKIIGN